MSLQFIFGQSGAGKSTYLYTRIIEESMKHPEKNHIILVPEQFTMQTQKNLVMMHPRKGILNIDVLSFGRLAHRVFDEVGSNTNTVLNDTGINFILRKVGKNYKNNLQILSNSLDKPGYINEIKSALLEFIQYDINESSLEEVIENLDPASYSYLKLQDMKTLYEGFLAYLKEKYITREEILDVLFQVMGESAILKNSTIALDGFTGFTPVQHRVLGKMLIYSPKVFVTVTTDKREDPFVLQHNYQLFALSKQMIKALAEEAKERKVKVDEPICLHDQLPRRFSGNEPLEFLEKNIFRHTHNLYKKAQSTISIYQARNPKEEVDMVAKEILSLVRNKGHRYREIGIIVSDMTIYGNYLENIFRTYDIPIFMDHKRNVLLNSFVEYIRSLLRMVEQGFSYESVFRFLRTGLINLSDEQIDECENYVLSLGIAGKKNWKSPWIRRNKHKAEELEAVNNTRSTLMKALDNLMSVLENRHKNVKEITLALYDFFVQEGIEKKLEAQEAKFQEVGELTLAKEYEQIYKVVIELFDQLISLLGSEEVSLKEYCELLDAGFEDAKVGVIPPSLDQVIAGDMERTRLKDIKTLFFIGGNDTLIPGNLGNNGLLTESDREFFEKSKKKLAPGTKEKAYIQKFYLYLHVTKPTTYLYLSFSNSSSSGKTLRPAYLIQEIKRLFPELVIEDRKAIDEIELTKESALTYLVQGLQDKALIETEKWKELYSWFIRNEIEKEKITQLLEASFYTKPTDKLTGRITEKLYGKILETSITRLEQFAACPCAHFIFYGLQLKEREVHRFQALDLGNIFHDAMDRFSIKVKDEQCKWEELEVRKRIEFVKDSVEESVSNYNNTILYNTFRNANIIGRIKRMMERTVWALTKHLEAGDFIPERYEVEFADTPSFIPKNSQIKLRGKIDRVDIYEENDSVFVKIIDYKTGTKSFDLVDVYYGLQLQLMVYLGTAMEMEQQKQPKKKVIPAGVFYYQIKDPFVEQEEDPLILEEKILKELRMDGILNKNEEVVAHIDKACIKNSFIVPIGRKKDGSLSKVSKVVSEEEFQVISQYTGKKIQELSSEILTGMIEAAPYERGVRTACDYCQYKRICRFDVKIPGYMYERFGKIKSCDVIDEMKGKIDDEG